MAVKKYENGVRLKCTTEYNTGVTFCIDDDTNEPFGRNDGFYDYGIFRSPDNSIHSPSDVETLLYKGFCYDEIDSDGTATLVCRPEKDVVKRLYDRDLELGRNVEKYF